MHSFVDLLCFDPEIFLLAAYFFFNLANESIRRLFFFADAGGSLISVTYTVFLKVYS